VPEPFVYRCRVRWVDTDASGIIHFTAAFRYTEAAEIEWYRAIGAPFPHLMDDTSLTVPRVHVEADYRSALRFDDDVAITVVPGRLGRSSLALSFELRRDGVDGPDGPPAVRVGIVVALTDRRIAGSVPWPEAIRTRLVAAGAVPA